MIISHKYKFIFVKTRKVAGTSLEIALSKHLGPEDVITPSLEDDEETRRSLGFPKAKNYEKPLREWTARDAYRYGRWLMRGKSKPATNPGKHVPPKRYWNHMTASEIRAVVVADIWGRYFKFSVDRNPWYRAASKYYWNGKKWPFWILFEGG